jgi:protein-S-isoprenylcysteine O-methyltransferase Ste14
MSRPRDREDLCEEHPYGDVGQIILAVVFFAVWGLDSFVLRFSTFPSAYVPLAVRIAVTAGLLVLALYVAVRGHRVIFGEVRQPPSVIKNGIFSYTRHPIYLATMLFYLGLVALTLSVASAILWVIICIFYDRISAYEEDRLADRFGEDYTDYMDQVPRWLPRPGGFGRN